MRIIWPSNLLVIFRKETLAHTGKNINYDNQ